MQLTVILKMILINLKNKKGQHVPNSATEKRKDNGRPLFVEPRSYHSL